MICSATVPARWHTPEHRCTFNAVSHGLCAKHERMRSSGHDGVLFERALYLVACEHGYTRDQALAWLRDEPQWKEALKFPINEPLKPIKGLMPFIQVTRTTVVSPP